MSPKHKWITAVWCGVTMVATLALSHGHLIVREIMTHWPASDSWEGRLENALYTQGGLVFVAGLIVGGAMLARGHFLKQAESVRVRKEIAQRERHERATAGRHDAMMDVLIGLTRTESPEIVENGSAGALPKKRNGSGARPR